LRQASIVAAFLLHEEASGSVQVMRLLEIISNPFAVAASAAASSGS
jgi:hypothetical protein